MKIVDIDNIIKKLSTKPKRTMIILLVLIILFIIYAWLNGYLGEKGSQYAIPQNDTIDTIELKTDEVTSEKKTNVEPTFPVGEIKENINTQININSPHSTQIINQSISIKEAFFKKEIKENQYITKITFIQTDGIWAVGTKFRIKLQLSGPYEEYKFIQGLPAVRMMVITRENKEKGIIDYSTESAPMDIPIILEIKSKMDININKLYVEPYFNKR